jgi:plasmid stabilization system protein ParE
MIVEWSPEALERVTELAEWIALNNEEAAVQWVDDIFARVEKLSHSPRSGRMVPEEMRDELREVIWKKYRIIYRLEDGKINIVTVVHSRQNFDPDDL